jgi:hypothetical protein
VTEALFQLTFSLAAPFWALMIIAPAWSVTQRVISSPLIIVPPLLVYLIHLVPHLTGLWQAVSRPRLEVLQAFFSQPAPAAGLWAHLVAFDLFLGRWMYLDARERGIHPLVMAPLLVLTILLSPFGVLSYLAVRAGRLGQDGRPAARLASAAGGRAGQPA